MTSCDTKISTMSSSVDFGTSAKSTSTSVDYGTPAKYGSMQNEESHVIRF